MLGFVATFLVVLLIVPVAARPTVKPPSAAMDEANVFRQLFFLLTFFSIGLLADLRKLWQEGIGRLRRRLRGLAVRLRHLGRPRHLVDLFPRHQAADRRLTPREYAHVDAKGWPADRR